MLESTLQFDRGGVWLPGLGLWLDPHGRKAEDKVFVSHAHSDHIAKHKEVIVSEGTSRLMRARLGGERIEHVLPFFEARTFAGPAGSYGVTLLPAGHILGSSMVLVESQGGSLLYTGDFKLRRGLSAEPCDPSAARGVDVLIMETTFGRREYQFPPTSDVIEGVIHFCRASLDNDETPVLLGYSMGKCQEILCGLQEAQLPIMLHGTVYKLARIYEELGQRFPPYDRYAPDSARGKVLLCPPNAAGPGLLRELGPVRTALLTGWAVDPNCRFRYRVDAAFPLSDHADFNDLLELVRRVSPKRVCTLHGFASDFAQTLREMGYAACALSEPEQLSLVLPGSDQGRKRVVAAWSPPAVFTVDGVPVPEELSVGLFAETCAAIARESAKPEKVRILSDYLRRLPPAALSQVATWFTGGPLLRNGNRVLQLGWALLRDALCQVGELTEQALRQVYLKHSDFGETAGEVLSGQPPASARLSVEEAGRFFHEIHAARGRSGKLPILTQWLRRCQAQEATFLIRIMTGDLRIGLKEGLVEEAIARAFEANPEEVRQANLLLGRIGETARLAQARHLDRAGVVPLQPVKSMLEDKSQLSLWR